MMKRAALIVLPLAVVAAVVLPLALDQPFASQTPRVMAVVYGLRRWSPAIALCGLGAMAAMAIGQWRRSGRLAKAALVAGLVTTAFAMWFSRQNPFEWMFNPLHRPAFVPARVAGFVESNDLVIAVRIGDDSAAYPIRQMAYHHLVNDRIGHTPAVITY
jgi:uncharacterized protein DUF3179